MISIALLCAIAALVLLVSSCGGDSITSQATLTQNPPATEIQTAGESTDQATTLTDNQVANQSANQSANQADPQASTPAVNTESATTPVIDDHSDHTIRYTDSNLDIWPPQPLDITDVAPIQRTGIAAADEDSSATEMKLITSSPELIKSLGSRYAILAKHVIRDKSNQATQVEAEFFAYDTNQVATVTFDANSNAITRQAFTAASSYQPPESQQEVQLAIALASDALTQQGFNQHKNLHGTGLLAYPNATEVANSGHQFFNERKIYVTFGTGNGELPKFRALVNLSTRQVENSGAIQ